MESFSLTSSSMNGKGQQGYFNKFTKEIEPPKPTPFKIKKNKNMYFLTVLEARSQN